jgi:hypothetical protein
MSSSQKLQRVPYNQGPQQSCCENIQFHHASIITRTWFEHRVLTKKDML